MNYAIVTTSEEIDSLNFVPTLIVGFYPYKKEVLFLEFYKTFTTNFPDIDFIGCSGDSIIYNTIPHIDVNENNNCTFVCIDIKKFSYSLQLLSSNRKPHIKNDKSKHYSAIIFEPHYANNTEEIINILNQKENISGFYGGISGLSSSDLNQGTVFYNGQFSSTKTLVWLIDEEHYRVKGLSQHNFNPIGYSLEITHTEGYKLLEIENTPALDMIERMIGTINPESLASYDHPFFITSHDYINDSSEPSPLSAIQSIDRETKSITLYKKAQIGDKLKLSTPFSAKKQEAQLADFNQYHANNSVGFLFTCISYIGHWGDMEPIYLMHLAKNLNVPFIGFHSLGEIGPLSSNAPSLMQNQTLTLAVLSER
ncbi:MAG: FIST N-terminal domain-containing protein [Campylobacterota bacterium]|nr:FIST N-terminal domain-containing protein [Campylobacterota bacterium]